MNESVIFALLKDDKILCEKRDYLGTIENCILGGGVEDFDRKTPDYIQSAVRREAKEELGIEVEEFRNLGHFEAKQNIFNVVRVNTWLGEVPNHNFDNGNVLAWVPVASLIAQIKLPPLKKLLEDGF